jgi:Response regulator containing CheY-like receiver domain and AraC-type DNA-binding domain
MVIFERHGMDEKEFFRFFPLKNYHFPLHFHRAYELIYVSYGQLAVSIDQKEYLLQKNDLVFIFNNQMHEFKTIGYSEITVILFSPELIGDFFMNFKGFIPKDNVLHFDREIDLTKLNSIYSQKSFLYSVCADLINKTSFVHINQSSQTKVLYKILLYVEEHYSADCTLKAVAKHLQYDYPYLSKLFANLMSMTFTDYLNHYRISQACYLLKNVHQSIGEVATNCGYSNLRTFHRNFRKITGQSPKVYRTLD